jgi:hypothetical protein
MGLESPLNRIPIGNINPTDIDQAILTIKNDKKTRKDISLIASEFVQRNQNSIFYILILRIIDAVKQLFGSANTLEGKLKNKLSVSIQGNTKLVDAVCQRILKHPDCLNTKIQEKFDAFTYEKSAANNVKGTYYFSSLNTNEEFKEAITGHENNNEELKDIIKQFLPIAEQENNELITNLLNQLQKNEAFESKKNPNKNTTLEYFLNKLLKTPSFLHQLLTVQNVDIKDLVRKSLPDKFSQNTHLVESIASYIDENEENLFDHIIPAQLDLLYRGKKNYRDQLLKILMNWSNSSITEIKSFLSEGIRLIALRTNPKFLDAFSKFIEDNRLSISQSIEDIDQRYSENTLDFHAYNLIKNFKFRSDFFQLCIKDQVEQKDFESLVNNTYKQSDDRVLLKQSDDPVLKKKIAEYIFENKDMLKEKAQEIEILSKIDSLNIGLKREIYDYLKLKEVEGITQDEFISKIKEIFLSKALDQNVCENIANYIDSNDEEVMSLLEIAIKFYELQNKRRKK